MSLFNGALVCRGLSAGAGRYSSAPNTSASPPFLNTRRSSRSPMFSATRCDGRFSGRMIATRYGTPAVLSCLAHRDRRLGGQALAAQGQVHVVAHFGERLALDVLNGEPAVADELAIVCFDNPETMTVVRIVPLVPCDPVLCVGSRPLPTVRSGGIRRRKHRFDLVEVRVNHLPKLQADGGGRQHVRIVGRWLDRGCRSGFSHSARGFSPADAHAASPSAGRRARPRERAGRVHAWFPACPAR